MESLWQPPSSFPDMKMGSFLAFLRLNQVMSFSPRHNHLLTRKLIALILRIPKLLRCSEISN